MTEKPSWADLMDEEDAMNQITETTRTMELKSPIIEEESKPSHVTLPPLRRHKTLVHKKKKRQQQGWKKRLRAGLYRTQSQQQWQRPRQPKRSSSWTPKRYFTIEKKPTLQIHLDTHLNSRCVSFK